MKILGIICEYNPFHRGHQRQLRLGREAVGEDCALVCLMSGNYVQRGEPAVFSKSLRARAALICGADLVLELPLTVALSSAEGFAAGGVRILTALGCQVLCFGTESPNLEPLKKTAAANLDPAFDDFVRDALKLGRSYPAARQQALEALGAGAGLQSPNDILAVEYLKALLSQNSPMEPLPIPRPNTYHDTTLNLEAPSATALRQALLGGGSWSPSVPESLRSLYAAASLHSLEAGERALLARLRTLPEEVFAALPYGSEGLWRRFMAACRTQPRVEAILEAAKSKRYTRTRLQRMLMCAFLDLTAQDLERPAPYVRVLGFTDRGRRILRGMKSQPAGAPFTLVNAGQTPPDPDYYALETRAATLYGLFALDGPELEDREENQRVYYHKI